MPILGLDTATQVCSVAVATEDKLLAEITVNTKKTHSERLMPYISQLLEMAGLKKDELTGIAVSIGPGSFTGLRIGLATAKAMSYALTLPIVGLSTLEAMAWGCPLPNAVVSPMLDAQKGNVYQGVYVWQDEQLKTLISPRVVAFKAALEELATDERLVTVLGEGAEMYKKMEQKYDHVLLPLAHISLPRAASVAIRGAQLLGQGIHHEVSSLEPLYIRRSEAEELWERRNGVKLP